MKMWVNYISNVDETLLVSEQLSVGALNTPNLLVGDLVGGCDAAFLRQRNHVCKLIIQKAGTLELTS